MELESIISFLKNKVGEQTIIQIDENASPQAIIIDASYLLEACKELHTNEKTYFDMLSCVTGLDNGPEVGTMEVIYNLYSIPYEVSLMIKVVLNRNEPEVSSLVEVWKTADWLEREVYDMFGIRFTNHPDMRRILMPADWEGYPLRRDYKQQEYYRGIKVEY